MNGSEITSDFGFARKVGHKTIAPRAYEEGSAFESLASSSDFMSQEDLANGAGFSERFSAKDAREKMDATTQSPASERVCRFTLWHSTNH